MIIMKGVNALTLGERIKKVRKALDLTQQEFAGRIGTTANVLTNYETGRRNPSASAFNNICKTFNINETWLRTGEGEMFLQQTRDEEISAFLNELLAEESTDFRLRLITALCRLSPQQWDALEAVSLNLLGTVPHPGKDAKAEVEALAQQAAQLTRDQGHSEKGPDTQASSAKESGAV